MTFREAMSKTAREAKDTDMVRYLYYNGEEYYTSGLYSGDHLFKAYPGGRMVLTVLGKDFYERGVQ